jgi:hypothetical protein
MKFHGTLVLVVALSLASLGGNARAETAQQAKMTTCNATAKTKNLAGDERRKFMSSCLSAAPAAANSQQEKMKTCNAAAKAKSLAGDERRKFMSSCLSSG